MTTSHVRSLRLALGLSAALVLCWPSLPLAQGDAPVVVFGTRHGVALRTNGEVLTWGDNVGCQLGRRAGNTNATPAVMMRNVKQVAAAGEHTLALTVDGKVYGWGVNGEGQLGVGNTYDQCEGPVLVPSLADKTIAHIATGVGFSLAVTSAGDLWCSGDNGMGQCPGAKGETEVFIPVAIPDLAGKVTGVSAGAYHALALTRDGRLFAFGRGRDGQLGNGKSVNGAGFVPELTNVVSFAAGIWHSVAARQDGSVWAWGSNSKSQVCNGATTNQLSPVKLAPAGIVRVAAGGFTTMMQAADGTLYACGDNQFGSLGLGQPLVVGAPTKIPAASTTHPVLAAGGNNAAFSPDGCAIRIAGDNSYSVLGPRETITDSRTFIPRANLSLCAARSATRLGDVVNPAPKGGASGCWTPRVQEDSARDPKFAPLVQAMLTAEGLLKKNDAYLSAPEPVRMRSAISAGPAVEGGARIHIKAVPERKMDGSRLWTGECDVIPQVDRIGGAILQVSVFFNVDVRGQFTTAGNAGVPKLTGTVAGYPEYNNWVVITKDGRLPWIPVTLAEKLDEEEARRVRAVDEWKKTVAGWKPLDEAAIQKAYEAVKKTDPAGAEKMVASMRESAVETKRQQEMAPRRTAALEKQIDDLRKYRATFTAAQLAAPAVPGDPSGEIRRKLDADLAALRALPPAEQQQLNDLSRQGRAADVRALRAAHMERVGPSISDALAQYELVRLKPGDRDGAISFKPDPSFPNYAEPNRIQLITVMFSEDRDPKQTVRRAWQQKTKETFDFAALAALLK